MLTLEQEEILTGLMLGDGCLAIHKNGKNAQLSITRQAKDKKYLEYHALIFKEYNPKIIDCQSYDKRTNKIYYSSIFKTPVNEEFTKFQKIWYTKINNKNKKILPLSLKLTPLTIATWFADDGHITISNKGYNISLATDGFTHLEVEILQKKLENFKLKFSIYRNKSPKSINYRLSITSKEQVKIFVDLIKDYFPKGIERKSNIWENNYNLLLPRNNPSCIYCNSNFTYKNNKKEIEAFKCQECKKSFLINIKRKRRKLITKNDILIIKNDYINNNITQYELSKKYNFSPKTIFNIVNNKYHL